MFVILVLQILWPSSLKNLFLITPSLLQDTHKTHQTKDIDTADVPSELTEQSVGEKLILRKIFIPQIKYGIVKKTLDKVKYLKKKCSF